MLNFQFFYVALGYKIAKNQFVECLLHSDCKMQITCILVQNSKRQ